MLETIKLETDARGVCTLTLARPAKHNALSSLMIEEITESAFKINNDSAIRAVVLAADGPSFCAGGDLNWMKDQINADRVQRAIEAKKLAMMLNALNTLTKPLIGRIHGNAFGGGIGMACVCDVAIGVEGTVYGLTETRLGLIPATIGPYVIARLGEAMARRVFMSSRKFDASEALTLGVIARVVGEDALDAAIEAEIRPYMDCAPGAVAEAKRLARCLGPAIDDSIIAETIDALVDRWETDEADEGIAAFFEKRPADWQQD